MTIVWVILSKCLRWCVSHTAVAQVSEWNRSTPRMGQTSGHTGACAEAPMETSQQQQPQERYHAPTMMPLYPQGSTGYSAAGFSLQTAMANHQRHRLPQEQGQLDLSVPTEEFKLIQGHLISLRRVDPTVLFQYFAKQPGIFGESISREQERVSARQKQEGPETAAMFLFHEILSKRTGWYELLLEYLCEEGHMECARKIEQSSRDRLLQPSSTARNEEVSSIPPGASGCNCGDIPGMEILTPPNTQPPAIHISNCQSVQIGRNSTAHLTGSDNQTDQNQDRSMEDIEVIEEDTDDEDTHTDPSIHSHGDLHLNVGKSQAHMNHVGEPLSPTQETASSDYHDHPNISTSQTHMQQSGEPMSPTQETASSHHPYISKSQTHMNQTEEPMSPNPETTSCNNPNIGTSQTHMNQNGEPMSSTQETASCNQKVLNACDGQLDHMPVTSPRNHEEPSRTERLTQAHVCTEDLLQNFDVPIDTTTSENDSMEPKNTKSKFDEMNTESPRVETTAMPSLNLTEHDLQTCNQPGRAITGLRTGPIPERDVSLSRAEGETSPKEHLPTTSNEDEPDYPTDIRNRIQRLQEQPSPMSNVSDGTTLYSSQMSTDSVPRQMVPQIFGKDDSSCPESVPVNMVSKKYHAATCTDTRHSTNSDADHGPRFEGAAVQDLGPTVEQSEIPKFSSLLSEGASCGVDTCVHPGNVIQNGIHATVAISERVKSSVHTDGPAVENRNSQCVPGQLPTGEQEVQDVQGQLSTEEQDVQSVQGQLSTEEQDVQGVQSQLSTEEQEVQSVQGQLSTEEQEVHGVPGELSTEVREVQGVQSQLSTEEREVQLVQDPSPRSFTNIIFQAILKGFLDLAKN